MKFTKESLRGLIIEEIEAAYNEALSRDEEERLRAGAGKGLEKIMKHISAGEEKYKTIARRLAQKLQPALSEAIYNAIVSDEGFLQDLQAGAPGVESLYAREMTQDLLNALDEISPDIIQGVVGDIYDLGAGETGEQPAEPSKTAPALVPLPSGETELLDPR